MGFSLISCPILFHAFQQFPSFHRLLHPENQFSPIPASASVYGYIFDFAKSSEDDLIHLISVTE